MSYYRNIQKHTKYDISISQCALGLLQCLLHKLLTFYLWHYPLKLDYLFLMSYKYQTWLGFSNLQTKPKLKHDRTFFCSLCDVLIQDIILQTWIT